MEINFEYSAAWLLLLLPAIGVLVWWMYWAKNRGKDQYSGWSKGLRSAVSALRLLAFLVLAFLLLKPFIIDLIYDEEKPKLLLYSDVSKSVNDADQKKTSTLFDAVHEEFGTSFDIEKINFSGNANRGSDSAYLDQYATNYQALVEAVNEDFYNQNISAVMVATDGLVTEGLDPRFVEIDARAPLFTIALGDTALKPDFELIEVLHNKLVYLGNSFEVKARINATRLKSSMANVTLSYKDEVINTQTIDVQNAQETFEVSFLVEAKNVGLNQFQIAIDSEAKEQNLANNASDFFVDVLDSRTQILIIAKAPHPDVGAIKRAIENNDQYEVTTTLLESWDGNVNSADLVVLHGIPTDVNDMNKVKVIRDQQLPVLAVATAQISPLHFNRLDFGLQIEANRIQMDDVGAWVNSDFNLFSIPNESNLDRFPPMSVIFSDFKFSGDVSSALFQRVGSIKSDKSLLVLSNSSGWKKGVLMGEGWWRWRLFERMKFANSTSEFWTDQVMVKLVQYLALRQKRERLLVEGPRKAMEGESIRFSAEYYNQSYELVNSATVNLSVVDSSGNTFEYRFKPKDEAYEANLGSLPVGNYEWNATADDGNQSFTSSGEFTVVMNRAEFACVSADHGFLERWSSAAGGTMVYPNSESVSEIIAGLERAQPIIHTSRDWIDIIEWKWIVFFVTILLAVEWFLRKYNGSY